MTTKPGLRNSDGCTEAKPSEYQRTAPLPKSVPRTGRSASATKRDGEADHREAAHLPGVIIEVSEHRQQGRQPEDRLPLDVVEGRQAVARGQRRRGGEPQQDADAEEQQDAAERPLVDRPPPARKDRLAVPNGNGAIDHFGHGTRLLTASPCPFFRVCRCKSSANGAAAPD